jgi:hypothetical protein
MNTFILLTASMIVVLPVMATAALPDTCVGGTTASDQADKRNPGNTAAVWLDLKAGKVHLLRTVEGFNNPPANMSAYPVAYDIQMQEKTATSAHFTYQRRSDDLPQGVDPFRVDGYLRQTSQGWEISFHPAKSGWKSAAGTCTLH